MLLFAMSVSKVKKMRQTEPKWPVCSHVTSKGQRQDVHVPGLPLAPALPPFAYSVATDKGSLRMGGQRRKWGEDGWGRVMRAFQKEELIVNNRPEVEQTKDLPQDTWQPAWPEPRVCAGRGHGLSLFYSEHFSLSCSFPLIKANFNFCLPLDSVKWNHRNTICSCLIFLLLHWKTTSGNGYHDVFS